MTNCLRCGKCCYINKRPCRYLKRLRSGLTECKVYEARLTKVIIKGVKCCLRIEQTHHIEGCPYNKLIYIK